MSDYREWCKSCGALQGFGSGCKPGCGEPARRAAASQRVKTHYSTLRAARKQWEKAEDIEGQFKRWCAQQGIAYDYDHNT